MEGLLTIIVLLSAGLNLACWCLGFITGKIKARSKSDNELIKVQAESAVYQATSTKLKKDVAELTSENFKLNGECEMLYNSNTILAQRLAQLDPNVARQLKGSGDLPPPKGEMN